MTMNYDKQSDYEEWSFEKDEEKAGLTYPKCSPIKTDNLEIAKNIDATADIGFAKH